MRSATLSRIIIVLFALILVTIQAKSWGFWAHKRINRLAVFTLPPEMIPFFKEHIEWMTEHAVDPDKRRYAAKGEASRHYIDVDHYGEYPFEEVPRKWHEAVAKYTEDTLQEWGIVPWHILLTMQKLTEAFSEKHEYKILRYSVDLGHYIGDAHVPLHTTENYNGQLTGQDGIHGFWESRLPELYGESYKFFVGRAVYIADPNEWVWNIVLSSHIALDSVLGFERMLTDSMPEDVKFNYEKRGELTVRVYSEKFSEAYHTKLNGMVERRMQNAVKNIGSAWYTCWVNAGQPDLQDLDLITANKSKQLEADGKVSKKAEVRKHSDNGYEVVE